MDLGEWHGALGEWWEVHLTCGGWWRGKALEKIKEFVEEGLGGL